VNKQNTVGGIAVASQTANTSQNRPLRQSLPVVIVATMPRLSDVRNWAIADCQHFRPIAAGRLSGAMDPDSVPERRELVERGRSSTRPRMLTAMSL
jgi:hypothetical protein